LSFGFKCQSRHKMTDTDQPITIVYKKTPRFPADVNTALAAHDIASMDEDERFALEIKKRDNFRCFFCVRQSFDNTIHHKYPKRFGGKDSLGNCITVCRPCHDKLEMLISESIPKTYNNFIGLTLNKLSRTIRIWSEWSTKDPTKILGKINDNTKI